MAGEVERQRAPLLVLAPQHLDRAQLDLRLQARQVLDDGAILASILPSNADHKKFLHALGIHGDPLAAKRRLDLANRNGERLAPNPYGYERSFQYSPDVEDLKWIAQQSGKASKHITLLDPTAGGGSIPFEAERLRLKKLRTS